MSKRSILTLFVCAAGLLPSRTVAAQTPMAVPPVAHGIAITGADVLTMSGKGTLKNYTVLVADGRIVRLGPAGSIQVPAGYKTIDGRGQTLLPGLVDMHVHFSNFSGAPGDPAQRALAVMLSYGVTTVRSMAGAPNHIALRDAVEQGRIPGPRIYAGSTAFNNGNVTSVPQAIEAVDNAKKAGFDLIKSHNLPDVPVWQAIEEEAKKVGLPVAGHVTNEVGLSRALAAGEEVEHLDGAMPELLPPEMREGYGQVPPPPILAELDKVSDQALAALAQRVKAAHSTQDPTIAIFERLADIDTPTDKLRAQPTMRYVPPPVLQQWAEQHDQFAQAGFTATDAARFIRFRRRLVAAYHRAGVPIMAGSDTAQSFQISGDGLIAEIGALSNAGLGPEEALKSATIVPRDYLRSLVNGGSSLGWKANFGTIEQGARGDLVLVRGNPVEDLSVLKEPEWVIAAGRPYDHASLLALRDQAAADAQGNATPAPPAPPAPSAAATPPAQIETAGAANCADAHLPPTARCGVLMVAENRAQKGGRQIPIRYAVLPAASPSNLPPLVVIPGGPGLGGVQSGGGTAHLFAAFNRDRDILLVDQRGTGASNRLACPAWSDKGDPFAGLDGPPLTEIAACRTGLEAKADLTQYGTRAAARDLDQVRSKLGYKSLALFGMSYGTRVALDYARLFPAQTDRVVIRSSAPAAMKLPLWTPRDVQHSYEVLAQTCRSQPACAARHDLAADLTAINRRLDQRPIEMSFKHPQTGKDVTGKLDRDAFGEIMFFMLYMPELYTQLPPLLTRAAAGDFNPLIRAAAPIIFSMDDSIAWGMYYSVVCKEDVDRITPREITKAVAGTFMGRGPIDRQRAICAQWTPDKAEAAYIAPVKSSKPVLIISGIMDPVAGKPWADEIQRTLPDSRSIEFKGASHLPPLPGCSERIMRDFLAGTEPRALDTSCVAQSAMQPLKM